MDKYKLYVKCYPFFNFCFSECWGKNYGKQDFFIRKLYSQTTIGTGKPRKIRKVVIKNDLEINN